MRFAFIDAEKVNYPVRLLCRVLEVSRSGYYAWRGRESSERTKQDAVLSHEIRVAHKESRGTYGCPRITKKIRRRRPVSRKRIARLMRANGLRGCAPRAFRVTTDSDHDDRIAPNLAGERAAPTALNQVWVADITYVRTWQGWLYLAVVVDLFSRRVVGWSLANHMRTELISDALTMAIGRRLPPRGLMHHSDRGSQYASGDFQRQLDAHGITCSMSRRGNCWDNATAESFFATLKNELVYRRPWPTREAARNAIAEFIECFYNPTRLHSSLDYLSPAEYENKYQMQRLATAA